MQAYRSQKPATTQTSVQFLVLLTSRYCKVETAEMAPRELLELQVGTAETGEMEREVNQGYKDQQERRGNKDLQGQRMVELPTPGGGRHLVLLYQELS